MTVEEFTRLTRDKPKKKFWRKNPARKTGPARSARDSPAAACLPRPCRFPNRCPKNRPWPILFAEPVEKAPAEASPIRQLRPVARPAPPKPKPVLDVSQIRALLNKTPDTPAETEAVAEEEVASENIRLTLNEIDAFAPRCGGAGTRHRAHAMLKIWSCKCVCRWLRTA